MSRAVPCPRCGSPLDVVLQVQVESRLLVIDGKFYVGGVRQSPAEIRERAARDYCSRDGSLYLEADEDEGRPAGEVVFCSNRSKCEFTGTLSKDGIES